VAVIVGFLLTAGKAWTGLATPRGATLAVMAGLWLAARLSAVWAPYAAYAVLDVVLLPWVAFVLIRVLLKAGNRRNLPLGAILLLLATANLTFHAAVLGWLDLDPLRALHAGLALVVMIECVIAGRVIPAFTMSALPGRQLKVPAWLERSTLAATALSLAAWVLLPANLSRLVIDPYRDACNTATDIAGSVKLEIPVIASGGVGSLEHLADGVSLGHADAVLAASIFHYGEYTVLQAKQLMAARGIEVRL
jgi:hypothetical protein